MTASENAERIRRANWLTDYYGSMTDMDPRVEPREVLTDILVDLMHWADDYEDRPGDGGPPPDFDDSLRIARDHFEYERKYPDED
jgi:hypothetical protein